MDRGDLFWLAYLVFYFLDPLFRRSLVYWLECLGFAAIFVALYVAMFQLRRIELRVACIAGIYLLGAAYVPDQQRRNNFLHLLRGPVALRRSVDQSGTHLLRR